MQYYQDKLWNFTLAIIEIMLLLHFRKDFDVSAGTVNITIITLLILAFLAHSFIFALFFFINGFLILLNFHFLNVYSHSFTFLGQQIISVVIGSNKGEMKGYLPFIGYKEIISFVVLLLAFIYTFIVSKKRYYSVLSRLILVILSIVTIAFGILKGYPSVFIDEIQKFKALDDDAEKQIIAKSCFKWDSKSTVNTPENVIFVIGESARYDDFIKYFEPNENKNLIWFDDAISQYGYTNRALPQLLSRKPVENMSDYFKESSIFKLYEEAGFETYYISYVSGYGDSDEAIKYVVSDAMHNIVYGPSKRHYLQGAPADFTDDMDVIPILKGLIFKNHKKKLIVLKLIGSHYRFEDRYPKAYDKVLPSAYGKSIEYTKENKNLVLNTYQNAIHYHSDVIKNIEKVVDSVNPSTLMVFSSDHALGILDNDIWYDLNVKKAYHIPLFFYANNKYLNNPNNQQLWLKVYDHKYDPIISSYIFETLTSLSQIKRTPYNRKFDMTAYDRPYRGYRKVCASNVIKLYEELW